MNDFHVYAVMTCAVVGSLSSVGNAPVCAQQLDVPQAVTVVAESSHARPEVATETFGRLVTIRLDQVSLKQAVDAIAASARVQIQYREAAIRSVGAPVSLHAVRVPLGAALNRILAGTSLYAVVTAEDLVTIKAAAVRQGTIVGKIVSKSTGKPVAGVTVLLDNASNNITNSVTSGADGIFRLSVPAGTHRITFRAVGFARLVETVAVGDGESTVMDVKLDPVASVLDEVIVTGTVIPTERKAIATPITVIHAQEIERRGITRLEELFRGDVPGLLALDRGALSYSTTSAGLGVRTDIYARGTASLNGAANPLKTYIDGVELVDPALLGTIDPRSIERIEIVTGPQAATIYGSGALGGVMQIFTKKGNGRRTSELKLTIRYGILQNNYSNGRTPEHHDILSLDGGTGPEFSYTSTASYDYLGQWQPKLYNRRWGMSMGMSHAQDRFTLAGSVSATGSTQGTWNDQMSRHFGLAAILTGPDGAAGGSYNPAAAVASSRVSTSSSQNLSFNGDYRVTTSWRHQITVGRNQNTMSLKPVAPDFSDPIVVGSDTLFRSNRSTGQRITWGYNTSFISSVRWLSSSLTLGANGSDGDQLSAYGCQVSANAPTFVGCRAGEIPDLRVPMDSRSWGSFGTWQVGLFGQLYTTFGVRLEQNPYYGRRVKLNFTPTNGLTYTLTVRDISLKLMGSYGRATRAPEPSQRDERIDNDPTLNPPQYLSQFANPDLHPEYSRGPQGGVELYLGNLGSLTINHYQQTVTDLIQRITADSIFRTHPIFGFGFWALQDQYVNVGKVRQHGWESTGALNAGPLSVKGTYSWSDSRVLSVNPSLPVPYQPGQSIHNLPTHSGSASISYARGQTSFMMMTNWVGATITTRDPGRIWVARYAGNRSPYGEKATASVASWNRERRVAGYTRVNIAGSHRLSPDMSLTLNVVNAGNNFQSDDDDLNPTLGRQTTFGLSYRFGKQ